MEELFSLPVSYKGEEIEVPVTLRVTGYSPRFIALLDGVEVTIEKDEEGNFRALIYGESVEGTVDPALLLSAIEGIRANFG